MAFVVSGPAISHIACLRVA